MNWYKNTYQEVLKGLHVDPQKGLAKDEVEKRRQKYGENVLKNHKDSSWLVVFLSQFKSPLIYILLLAAVIIFFVGEDPLDAFIISGILFFNAIIGTIQEGRTRNILRSLQKFIKTTTIVLRDGYTAIISDEELVPGDIIVLQEGQRVPADARIFIANNLGVDESLLTGESGVIKKQVDALSQDCAIADRSNMLYRGTYVVRGSGKAIVVAIGADTQVGKVQTSIEAIDTDIPLKRELDRLSYYILLFILGVCLFLFVVGALSGKPIKELLIMLTALFICVVPEGLPVVLTLVLASGAYRMAQQNVLVKNLQAVEALGRVDIIMIDKTGTLTRNEMMVSDVLTSDAQYCVSGQGYFKDGEIQDADGRMLAELPEQLDVLGKAAAVLSSAEISYMPEQNLFEVVGDPTEAAMKIFAQKSGYTKEDVFKEYEVLFEVPFDSQLRYHAIFLKKGDECVAFLAGSPESILERSSQTKTFASSLTSMLDEGLRVVALGIKRFACSDLPAVSLSQEQQLAAGIKMVDHGMQLLGLLGIQDAIRSEVKHVISHARDAGFRVVMATGDHKKTALFVAQRVGLYTPGDIILTGPELDEISDEQLKKQLMRVTVFARVTPDQKLRIVKLYRELGYMIAMTGDGINDAPPLIAADVGIAMGNIGTEVAKNSADLVLLDDSFTNVIAAVEQGRHIFNTLRRVVLYFFATNMGEILIVLFALIAGLPLPITAAQILWLNFVTDGFLDSAISMEPQRPGLAYDQTFRERKRLVDTNLIVKMMYMAVPMGIGSLLVFWWYMGNLAHARTMTLITMAMYQWFNAWNCRSETESLFSLGLFTNRWLIGATLLVLMLQGVILYVPFAQNIFDTVPITGANWLIIIVITAPMVLIEEVRKWCVQYYWPRSLQLTNDA